MDGTIIQQGRFTSKGISEFLDIRSDLDWIEVINETQWATTQASGRGIKFEWYRGLAIGHAFEMNKADSSNITEAKKVTSGGFTLIDPTTATISAPITGTTITKADPPVCTAANHGLINDDQVLFSNLSAMAQIAVVVFTIDNVTTNTFELRYMDTNTANFTAESSFEVRSLPPFSWNNSFNWISAVITGTTTQIQFTSNDPSASFVVGQILTFGVGPDFGMTQLDGKIAKILSIDTVTNTYTVDLDSTTFTPFAWPNQTAVPLSHPTAQLFGNESSSVISATKNTDNIQMKLGAGINGPAGSTGDVIYWKAGKSFSVTFTQ